MILILAHHYDAEAEWLYEALRRHRQPAVLLSPEALGVDYSLSLFVRSDGDHAGLVSFGQSGAAVETGDVRYAINRLGYIEPLTWQKAEPTEKAYATAEINALFPAFVRTLRCPVSNPVRHGVLWTGAGFEAKRLAKLRQRGLGLHPSALAPAAEALAALSRAAPASIRRWLAFDGAIFAPPEQRSRHPEIDRAMLDEGGDEMIEVVAIEAAGSPAPDLIWITRTPALSCYGPALVEALADRVAAAVA